MPRFKEGDYDGGIRAGVESILSAIAGEYTADTAGGGSDSIVDMGINLFAFGFFLVIITPFTLVAVFSRGFPSWFLYAFLIPFWTAFPMATIGAIAGGVLCATYLIGFPIAKFIMAKTPGAKRGPRNGANSRCRGPVMAAVGPQVAVGGRRQAAAAAVFREEEAVSRVGAPPAAGDETGTGTHSIHIFR